MFALKFSILFTIVAFLGPTNTLSFCLECVKISDCPLILKLVQKNSVEDSLILRLLHCYVNKEIYVRCPTESELETIRKNLHLIKDHNNCGLEPFQNKIAGGERTAIDEYLWIGLLKYENPVDNITPFYACHGNLINNRYLLTAAHCVVTKNVKLHSVVLGEYDITKEKDCQSNYCNEKPKEILIESTHPFPGYNSSTFIHDIALIRMAEEISFTEFIKPVCIPPPNLPLPFNETLWIAGWGNKDATNVMNTVKMKAKFQLKHSCSLNFNLSTTHFCVAPLGNASTCPRDSGGPLMLRRKFQKEYRFILIGIDSLGIGCAYNFDQSRDGIYTRVSPYLAWILSTIEN